MYIDYSRKTRSASWSGVKRYRIDADCAKVWRFICLVGRGVSNKLGRLGIPSTPKIR